MLKSKKPPGWMEADKLSKGVAVSVTELTKLRLQCKSIFRKPTVKTSAPLAGGYASPFRGRGMDFNEVRVYQPGDDVRNIDWRVTARTNKTHTKLFVEERERPVFMLVDLGPTMQFATKVAFKSVIASKIAVLLAWAADGHGDRVGAFLFDHKHHLEIKPLGGKKGVLKLIHFLASWKYAASATQNSNNFTAALLRAHKGIRSGSLIYILSDFYKIEKQAKSYLTQLARHNDVVCITVLDAIELDFSQSGYYEFTDGQQFGFIDTRMQKNRDQFVSDANSRRAEFSQFSAENGIHQLTVLTDDDLVKTLHAKLAKKTNLKV